MRHVKKGRVGKESSRKGTCCAACARASLCVRVCAICVSVWVDVWVCVRKFARTVAIVGLRTISFPPTDRTTESAAVMWSRANASCAVSPKWYLYKVGANDIHSNGVPTEVANHVSKVSRRVFSAVSTELGCTRVYRVGACRLPSKLRQPP